MILRESGPRSHWRRPLVFEPRITVRGTNGNRRGTDRRRVVRSTGIWTLAAYTHWGIESTAVVLPGRNRVTDLHRAKHALSALFLPLSRPRIFVPVALARFSPRSAHSERQRRRGYMVYARERMIGWSPSIYEERKEQWWQKREEESMAGIAAWRKNVNMGHRCRCKCG